MKILNYKEISLIVGAGGVDDSISATFEVKLKETPLEQLPLLSSLTNDCTNNKWNVVEYTNKLIDSGIDSNIILINTSIKFSQSVHEYI